MLVRRLVRRPVHDFLRGPEHPEHIVDFVGKVKLNPATMKFAIDTVKLPSQTIHDFIYGLPKIRPMRYIQRKVLNKNGWLVHYGVKQGDSLRMLYAYDGETLVNSFLVSTGTYLHPTVTGQFHIYVKYRYTLMTGPGYYLPDVPYTMYFYEGYGIHGTYWHNNFGHPMSHGCVNMRTSEAGWLYEWASVGTLVNVHD